MKHSAFPRFWSFALLMAFAALPAVTTDGWAAPDPNPPAAARGDLRRDNNDDYRSYRGTVEILLPGTEFNARIDGRIYKIYATQSTRDLRVGDRVEIYGQMDRGVNIRYAKITRLNDRDSNRRPDDNDWRDRGDDWRDRNDDWRDRDNDWRDRDDDWRDRNDDWRDRDVYVGEVTYVRNDRELEVRSEGRTYRVYCESAARNVRRGDRVRVSGSRVSASEIREARVNVLRDRNDEVSYAGVVATVRNNGDFDVWVDGLIYNVYPRQRIRDLNAGDTVRVEGERYGDNDIRNARARITRRR